MNIVNKKIDEIKPYENNPRFNDDAVEKVAKSIKEFGQWRDKETFSEFLDKTQLAEMGGESRTKDPPKQGESLY